MWGEGQRNEPGHATVQKGTYATMESVPIVCAHTWGIFLNL